MNPIELFSELLAQTKPIVMGILNVTPDSFSDGGQFNTQNQAIDHALEMHASGATIIDIGGESTRPGADPVSVEDECKRVLPIIQQLVRQQPRLLISIDTSKPEVMRRAVDAGVGMINDVCALRNSGAQQAALDCKVPVCLMHMSGTPRSMQQAPQYTNVVEEVRQFLQIRINQCLQIGIPRAALIVDPGFGFGKTLAHNLELLRRLSEFQQLELPILVGLSRKSMFAALLDLPVEQRLNASIAAAVIAVMQGATIVRVHDVRATREALAVVTATMNSLEK